jgi:translocation and assembly module TamA
VSWGIIARSPVGLRGLRVAKGDVSGAVVARSLAISIVLLFSAVGAIVAPGRVIADVVIDGIPDSLKANVIAHLGLSDLECNAPPWLVRWQYREADKEVATGLEAFGYYGATVEKKLSFPSDGCWQAQFQVVLGNPVIVTEVNASADSPLGSEAAIVSRLNDARALAEKPLNHGRYEDAKRGLLSAAGNLGYFDAKFARSEVRVEVAAHRAVITLDFVGGTRYVFGDIDVVGDALERRLVDAYVPFHPGEPFDAAKVALLRHNLADSGYFRRTVVTADNEVAVDHRVPIRIELVPRRPPWTYSVGVGYETDTGARIRTDAENNLLTRSGHRASAKAVFSEGGTSFDLAYKIPHKNPVNDWFVFDAGVAHLDTDTSRSDIQRIGARHTYPVGTWVASNFADLTREDFKIADTFGQSRLMLFGSTLGRISPHQPSRPTEGYRLDTTVRGASTALGSDTDFLQLKVNAKTIFGLTKNLRAIIRGEVGWTWKDEFSELPPTVRFFAGGDTSIRGYDYQSIGPEQDGNVIGGSKLLIGSLEFDYRVWGNWAAAAFVDSGSAYDDEPQFFTGVGGGVVYQSAVGPIRVYLGHPLDHGTVEWRLHIVIGPDL